MRKIIAFFRSFPGKTMIALVVPTLVSMGLAVVLIWHFTFRSQFVQFRREVLGLVHAAALGMDGDALMRIPFDRQGTNTQEYRSIAQKLLKLREGNALIISAYVLARTTSPGLLQFAVAPDLPVECRAKHLTSYPGDSFDARGFPEMLVGFLVPSVEKKLRVTEDGACLSGYAPVRDAEGNTVAVLGLDIQAEQVALFRRNFVRAAGLVAGLGILISLSLGLSISRNIISPLEKLTQGIHHIAMGNLRYRLNLDGTREITEIAQSFNRMISSLESSNRMLHGYFTRVVQSMVRILEARDTYTRGHSERVARYAERIALRLRLPEDKISLMKDAALLHDIGKLGVPESLLNKEGKLTEEEWDQIRKHPLVGEEILKPIFPNKETLLIVRGHHERHDGKGYPDRLNREEVSIYAQVISVADAYDAMTSPRAYRPARTKEQAAAELAANRGTQFNPRVVDTFLKLLKEEYSTLCT